MNNEITTAMVFGRSSLTGKSPQPLELQPSVVEEDDPSRQLLHLQLKIADSLEEIVGHAPFLPQDDAAEVGLVTDLFEEILNGSNRPRPRHGRNTAGAVLLLMKSCGTYTYEHCTRLVDLSLDLAKEMGYEDDQLYREVEYGVTYKDLGEAAYYLTRQDEKQLQSLSAFLAGLNLAQESLLHDIGKMLIPHDILMKPGPLTPRELAIMRMHPVWGHHILSKIPDMQHAIPVVRHHHERWDGTGYPDRLAQERIPLAARLVSVTDAYDAMTAERPYRRPLSSAEARQEILRMAGSQFDPYIAHAFARMLGYRLAA